MLAGDFQRKIRQLNSELRIFCGNDETKPAGLYMVVNGEYEQIMSVDKNFLPPHVEYDEVGHIIKSGWRRVVKHLIKEKLVDRRKAEQLFQFHMHDRRRNPGPPKYVDPIKREMDRVIFANLQKTGRNFQMSTDEVMDIANELRRTRDA